MKLNLNTRKISLHITNEYIANKKYTLQKYMLDFILIGIIYHIKTFFYLYKLWEFSLIYIFYWTCWEINEKNHLIKIYTLKGQKHVGTQCIDICNN
jgi:hypothetical protein